MAHLIPAATRYEMRVTVDDRTFVSDEWAKDSKSALHIALRYWRGANPDAQSIEVTLIDVADLIPKEAE